MSASGSYLRLACLLVARAAAGKQKLVDDSLARKIGPVAVAVIVQALQERARTVGGVRRLRWLLSRYCEDVLTGERRLAAADVRARGDALARLVLRRRKARMVRALADRFAVDLDCAQEILALAAAAAVSALSKARRELHLKSAELSGVIKSEAALVEGADPALAAEVWRMATKGRRRTIAQTVRALASRETPPTSRAAPASAPVLDFGAGPKPKSFLALLARRMPLRAASDARNGLHRAA
jgi:hypothetical protein